MNETISTEDVSIPYYLPAVAVGVGFDRIGRTATALVGSRERPPAFDLFSER